MNLKLNPWNPDPKYRSSHSLFTCLNKDVKSYLNPVNTEQLTDQQLLLCLNCICSVIWRHLSVLPEVPTVKRWFSQVSLTWAPIREKYCEPHNRLCNYKTCMFCQMCNACRNICNLVNALPAKDHHAHASATKCSKLICVAAIMPTMHNGPVQ